VNELLLAGCRTEPLGSYLKALGVLRLVGEQRDSQARGHWHGDTFVLTTVFDQGGLEAFFLDDYAPTPAVSPWNNHSGFKADKNPSAVDALALVEKSSEPRLAGYRNAVEEAHRIHEAMLDDSWDKATTVRACRERLPDDALPWIDAAVVLAASREVYPPLLGTGGNDGRFDFSVAFMQRLGDVLRLRKGPAAPDRVQSAAWLTGSLFDVAGPLARAAIGQFDPGASGGANSAPTGGAPSLVNPWDWVLLVEGTMAFASASARRLSFDGVGRAAVPFTSNASPVGYGSSAADESSRGEIWAPVWENPATSAEVLRLIEEGRVSWRGRQARSGLDFARAASSLGVDRGIGSFVRHALLERNGRSTAAVPVGRVVVRALPAVALTAALDPWLERIRGGANAPDSVTTALAVVDRALFESTQTRDPRSPQTVLIAVADLERTIGLAKRFREAAGVAPVVAQRASDWLPILDDATSELRIAAALASIHDDDGLDLRGLLRPVVRIGRRVDWSDGPAPVPGLGWASVARVLAAALVRRALEVGRSPRSGTDEQVGVQPAFRYGLFAPADDVARFVLGELDDERFSALLQALLLLDWTPLPRRQWESRHYAGFIPPAWSLLAPFFHGKPIRISGGKELRLLPEGSWPRLLAADRTADVLTAALRRLRVARLHPVLEGAAARQITATAPPGERIAAALLVQLAPGLVAQFIEQHASTEE
jgi:CRISPR-associated protein Csx17